MSLRSTQFSLKFTAIPFLICGLLASTCHSLNAQSKDELSAFIGRWQLNLVKSKLLKYGPEGKNEVRSASYTFIFFPSNAGLLLDIYSSFPRAAPDRSIEIHLDNKPHPCEAACRVPGVQDGQTYTYRFVDEHVLTRATFVKQRVVENNIYAASLDGRTLTMITWNGETPQWQNTYVFEKQD